MPLISINPATGEKISEIPELTSEQIQTKLALGDDTFQKWRETDFAERAAKMKRLAEILRANAQKYGEIMTREMGKPITAARAEVEKCAWVCEYYAENAENFLSPEIAESDASESFVRFDPIGPVLAVMPWNFPFWQVLRFAAPTIMAGNVGLLKHASNVQGCAAAIEESFILAGFAQGIFQNLAIGSGAVETVIRDPRVKAITLTGSEYAGRKVAEIAGDEIKKVVLELGGSDPFIVLTDADVALAAETAATARFQNCGQSCIAAKRFIVVENVAEKFIELFKIATEKLIIGDPMNEETQIGPMVNQKSLEEIDRQVQESIKKGARLIIGGKKFEETSLPRACRGGYFYSPTILADVKIGMPVYDEETFGPVAAVITVRDEAEAIRVANDTPFGLGSSIWTKNLDKAKQLASHINAGSVFINGLVKSDPRLPFGGTKKSGYGRELAGFGIREFVNVKTVWVK
ncbi:MAG: succinate-semialdehyde dehydrogenase [Candidatus Magasanikbacteria bacterium RIFCSPHIGHO2_01_FULL_41_23]|uniref:Succinate-semialdehyde dehydrogenase n=1 Tax=Candidatus Magasanikbacteria bacterium RIFCSPLOWO2_01_FULL_40_15 TaxID=1798686 RepID=A0A1F6N4C8_9BACT|nr:MAG: succinate-semialdehyde dehydrogenase [Candidatus Magasanikbacteria bacterium RIFCSPHIGHO2_01_FULL_41_23]OGH66598.1 MAG: succinate-semialdehyde dehydrogenase [Candidatus Magasanikbacteria bacterium RIFCSPHIGHO2_02_FULL_41_35]OGH78789.1 MAG: succinate-semialdehyde dehydrogenase [Candidatus Magasanikbacteria bacterium RIFCSPLOWO2_01_FULL_40_15]